MATDNVGLKSNLIQAIYKGFYGLLLRGGVGGSLDSFGCAGIQFKSWGGVQWGVDHTPQDSRWVSPHVEMITCDFGPS